VGDESYLDPRIKDPAAHLTTDERGAPLPPWRVFGYWPTSMGWRMGPGEDYLILWHVWFRRLSGADQGTYRRRYRPPLYWWYAYLDDRPALGCIVIATLSLITLPLTLPSFWWNSLVRRR